MESRLKKISNLNNAKSLLLIIDAFVTDVNVDDIIKENKEYFELIKFSLIGVTFIQFSRHNDTIYMRTFDSLGVEAATYEVQIDCTLYLSDVDLSSYPVFSKHGLHLHYFDIDHRTSAAIYQALDAYAYDVAHDGFGLEEGLEYVDNYMHVLENRMEASFA